MDVGDCCAICSEVFSSRLLVITQEINDLLKSLIVNIVSKI